MIKYLIILWSFEDKFTSIGFVGAGIIRAIPYFNLNEFPINQSENIAKNGDKNNNAGHRDAHW